MPRVAVTSPEQNWLLRQLREWGIEVAPTSGTRTREQQAALYARYRRGEGALAAPPGRSKHEEGLALDFPYNDRLLRILREMERTTQGGVKVLVEEHPKGGRHIHVSLQKGIHQKAPSVSPISLLEVGRPPELTTVPKSQARFAPKTTIWGKIERLRQGIPFAFILQKGASALDLPLSPTGTLNLSKLPKNIQDQLRPFIAPPIKNRQQLIEAIKRLQLSPDFYAQIRMKQLGFKHLTATHLLNLENPTPVIINGKAVSPLELLRSGRQSAKTLLNELRDFQNYILSKPIDQWQKLPSQERKQFLQRAALTYILARPNNLRILKQVNPELAEQVLVTVRDLERRQLPPTMRALTRVAEVGGAFARGVVATAAGLVGEAELLRATGGVEPTEHPAFPAARGTIGKIATTLGAVVGTAPQLWMAEGVGRAAVQKTMTDVFKWRLVSLPTQAAVKDAIQLSSPLLARTWMARTMLGRMVTGAAVGTVLGAEQAALALAANQRLRELGAKPVTLKEALGIVATNAAFFALAGAVGTALEPLETYLRRLGWRFTNYLADKGLLTERGRHFLNFQVIPRLTSALKEATTFEAAAVMLHGPEEYYDREKLGHNLALGALFGFLFPEALRGRTDRLAAHDPQRFRALRQNLDPIAESIINASMREGRTDSRLLIRNFTSEVATRRLSLDEAAVLWDAIQSRISAPVVGHWLPNLLTYATFDELLEIFTMWRNLLGGIPRPTAPPRPGLPPAPPETPPPSPPGAPPTPPTAPPQPEGLPPMVEPPRPPTPETRPPEVRPPEVRPPEAPPTEVRPPEARPEARAEVATVTAERFQQELLPADSWFTRPGAPQLPVLERVDPADAEWVIRDYLSRRQQKPANAMVVSRDLYDLYGEGVLKGKIRDRTRLADFIFFNWEWLQAQRLRDAQTAQAAPPPPTPTTPTEAPTPSVTPTVEAPIWTTIRHEERPPASPRRRIISFLFPEVYEEAEQENRDPEHIEPLTKLRDEDRVILEHEAVKPENVPRLIQEARDAGYEVVAVRYDHPRFGTRYHLFVYPPDLEEVAHRAIELRASDLAGADLSLAEHVELGRYMAQDVEGFVSDVRWAAKEEGLTDIIEETDRLLDEFLREHQEAEAAEQAVRMELFSAFAETARSVIPGVVHEVEGTHPLEYVLASEQGQAWRDRETGRFIGPRVADRAELEHFIDPALIDEALERAAKKFPQLRYAYRAKVREDGTVVGDLFRPDEMTDRVPLDALYFGLREIAKEQYGQDLDFPVETVWSRKAGVPRPRPVVEERLTTPLTETPRPERPQPTEPAVTTPQKLPHPDPELDPLIQQMTNLINNVKQGRGSIDTADFWELFDKVMQIAEVRGVRFETDNRKGQIVVELPSGRQMSISMPAPRPKIPMVLMEVLRDITNAIKEETASPTEPAVVAPPTEAPTPTAPSAEAPRPLPEVPPQRQVVQEVPAPEPTVTAPPTERREVWRQVPRNEIKVGDYVRTQWKGQTFEGTVIAIDPDEWARKTRGRFVAITIQTPEGQLVGMPWTDKATYERLEPIEEAPPAPTETPPTEKAAPVEALAPEVTPTETPPTEAPPTVALPPERKAILTRLEMFEMTLRNKLLFEIGNYVSAQEYQEWHDHFMDIVRSLGYRVTTHQFRNSFTIVIRHPIDLKGITHFEVPVGRQRVLVKYVKELAKAARELYEKEIRHPLVTQAPEGGRIPTEVTEHAEPERRPPEPERPGRGSVQPPERVPRVEEPEVLPEPLSPEIRAELPEPVSAPEGERDIGGLRERPGGEVVEHRPTDVEERGAEVAGREHGVGTDRGGDRRRRIGYYAMTDEDEAFILTPSAAQKRDANLEAIRTLKTLIAENREPTDEELSKLIRYVSFGGIPEALQKPQTREEFLRYLTEAEVSSILKAIPNAHYTNPQVARRLWDIVRALGFTGGKIVEPAMGVGFLIATAPSDLLENSEVIGVEIEDIAAKIAQILFPKATILNQPFETVDLPDDSIDLFISNVPFGNYPVYDPRYPQKPPIHDYFFLKALDKTKPGGYVVFITSTFTLDKQDSTFRQMMAEKGDLILALRLPRNAHYANALTQVVTDILVFRKRPAGVPYSAYGGEPFFSVANFPNTDIPINEYFHRHPEHLLGELTRGRGMYRPDEPMVVGSLEEALSDARWAPILDLLREKIRPQPVEAPAPEVAPTEAPPPEEVRPAEPTRAPVVERLSKEEFIKQSLRPGSYYLAPDGMIYRIGETKPVDLGKSPQVAQRNKDTLTRLIQLRDQLKWVFYLQEQGAPDEVLNEELRQLNEIYDAYRAKYGAITVRRSLAGQLFDEDPDYPLLEALEFQDPDEPDNEAKIQKADVFFKRVLAPVKEPERVSIDDPKEAIIQVLTWRGRLDFDWLAQKSGIPAEQWQERLWSEGLAFPDPETGQWEIREKYLSGNVYKKLQQAYEAAAGDDRFYRNVDALREVQPPRISLDDIVLPPGSPIISTRLMKAFLEDLTGAYKVKVAYSPHLATWEVWLPNWVNDRTEVREWTGGYVPFDRFVTQTLNRQKIVIRYRDPETRKYLVDREATSFVQAQQRKFWDHFLDWLKRNRDNPRFASLIEEIEDTYNELVGGWVEPKYDGSGLTFPGMNPNIQLYPHQKDAVLRILMERRGILAHEVGTGKTFTMIAAGMKMKQIGIIRKPMYVVPNSIMVTWRNEFKRLYPAARVLFIDAEEVEGNPEKRKRLINMAATGDWDAIVVSESIFVQFIPPSADALVNTLEAELQALNAERRRILNEVGREESTVKQIMKTINSMEARLRGILEEAQKRLKAAAEEEGVLDFGKLGVDFLFVDEAHHFKNYPFVTKLEGIRGLSTAHSKRAYEMNVRINELEQKYGQRRVVFATGTPISNTLAEVYHMLKFIVPERLREIGLDHFDAFSSALYSVRTSIVQAIHGLGFKVVYRLDPANLPEIMKLFRSIADVKFTTEMPYLQLPKVKRIVVPIQPSQRQIEKAHELQHRYENLDPRDPKTDNALKITHEGRQMALSPKLLNPDDELGPKIERAIEEIYKVWEATKGQRLTQVVFADRYRSPDGRFHLFREMMARLEAMGVPREEMFDITMLKEGGEEDKRQQIFRAFNEGKIRILFGTTQSLGEGVNIQQRLYALHHLDPTWKPAELMQREGRIVRQGNQNEEVVIYTYPVQAPSIDAYMYETLLYKADFIRRILRGEVTERNIEDPLMEQVLSYQELVAITTGDRRMKEYFELQRDVTRLIAERDGFLRSKEQIRRDLEAAKNSIRWAQERIATLEPLERIYAQNKASGRTLVINGQTFASLEGVRQVYPHNLPVQQFLSQLRELKVYGVDVALEPYETVVAKQLIGQEVIEEKRLEVGVTIGGEKRSSAATLTGNLLKFVLEFVDELFTQRLPHYRQLMEERQQQIPQLEELLRRPWEKEAEFREKLQRLQELEGELRKKKREEEAVVTEGDETPAAEETASGRDVEFPDDERPPRRWASRRRGAVINPFDVLLRRWRSRRARRRAKSDVLDSAKDFLQKHVAFDTPTGQLSRKLISAPHEPPTAFEQAFIAFVDYMYPLEKVTRALADYMAALNLPLPIERDPRLYIDDHHASAAQAHSYFHEKVYPLLETLREHGELENFLAYIIALHAKELNDAGIESGIETAEAQKVLNEIEDHWTRKGLDNEMGLAVTTWVQLNNELLDMLVAEGLVRKEAAEEAKQRWQFYVPFRRLMDEVADDLGIPPEGRLDVRGQSVFLPIQGSQRKILNPLEVFARKVYLTFLLINRNRPTRLFFEGIEQLRQALLQQLQQGNITADDPAWLFVLMFRPVRPVIRTEREEEETEEGVVRREVRVVQLPVDRWDRVHFFKDGKRQTYEVPDWLAVSFKGPQNFPQLFYQPLTVFSRLIRLGGTGLRPSWWLRNVIRDLLYAYQTAPQLLGPTPVHVFWNYLRFLFDKLRRAPDIPQIERDFYAAGVHMYTFLGEAMRGFEAYRRQLEKAGLLHRPAVIRVTTAAREIVLRPIEALEALGNKLEALTRQFIYREALRKGYHPLVARKLARDTTINFRRIGGASWWQSLLGFLPFVNARIQAVRTLVGAARFQLEPMGAPPPPPQPPQPPTGGAAGAPGQPPQPPEILRFASTSRAFLRWLSHAFFFVLLGLLAYLMNRNRKGFWQLPNWAFAYDLPFFIDDDRYVRLPLDDFQRVFATLGMMVGMVAEGNADDPAVRNAMWSALRGSLIPFQSPEDLTLAPARAIVEQVVGRELFTGREIEPRWMEELPPELRYTRRTLPVFVWLGRVMHISPERLQTLAESIFPATRELVSLLTPSQIVDAARRWLRNIPPEPGVPPMRSIPIVGGFAARASEALPPTIEEAERERMRRVLEAQRMGYDIISERYRLRANLPETLTRRDIERLQALKQRQPERYEQAVSYFLTQSVKRIIGTARAKIPQAEKRQQLTQEFTRLRMLLEERGWMEGGQLTPAGRRALADLFLSVAAPLWREIWDAPEERRAARLRALYLEDKEQFKTVLWMGLVAAPQRAIRALRVWAERDRETLRQALQDYLASVRARQQEEAAAGVR